MTIYIGTSGWQYGDWRPAFYPAGVSQARWLEHYAARFATVESNNAFYRLPSREVFEAWAARTPDDFVMAVKVSRYLSHILRLRDPAEPVGRFVDRVAGLGPKLGPVLLQLPPSLPVDLGRLTETLDRFPRDIRVAVEFRHSSWYTDEVRRLLVARGTALCLADRHGPRTPLWRTAEWGYVRLHQGLAKPRPCYGRAALRTWAERLAAVYGRDSNAFVYFNNDHRACAVRNATEFGRACQAAGLSPSRVPGLPRSGLPGPRARA